MENPAEPGNRQGGTIGTRDLTGGLGDRGIGFQAGGFIAVLLASTAILELFQGSNFWLYQWFERATVDTYWSAVVPLGALFDWVRKMFERGKAIREAKKAEIEEKAIRRGMEQGRQETTEQFRALLKQHGITLPPEVDSAMFGDTATNGS